MDMSKVECIQTWPIPRNVKELRGFLGLTGYYKHFIKGYGTISKPLTNLLKKDAYDWNAESYKAFNCLKQAIISAPVLRLPNFGIPFVVETDASEQGMGVVLLQEGHPIAFISKAFSLKNMGLSVYEKELMALVFAVTKWKHYLIGNHFIIRTDHSH